MDHKVSIIIIGRNEEAIIGRCIEAALLGASQIGGAEILFVDSDSTDNTAGIVAGYGIKVLPLDPTLRACPSAGRYWGSQHAKGDFILFLDADTLLYSDFLPIAMKHFVEFPVVGGISGYIDDLNPDGEKLYDIEERSPDIQEVKWLRGPCCFYRSKALRAGGSFDPNLATEEEAELGLRLIKKGWLLNIIPQAMACHTRCYHGQSLETVISTFRRDIRSKRLGEITRTIASAFRAGNGFAFCWLRLKTTILFLVWVLALMACLFLPTGFYPGFAGTALFILGAMVVLIKKRSLSQTLIFAPSKVLNLVDLLAGLNKVRP